MTSGVYERIARPVTARQLEVWQGIARGLCYKEIGNETGMAFGTVKVHASTLLRRIGARNKVVAALMWHGINI